MYIWLNFGVFKFFRYLTEFSVKSKKFLIKMDKLRKVYFLEYYYIELKL